MPDDAVTSQDVRPDAAAVLAPEGTAPDDAGTTDIPPEVKQVVEQEAKKERKKSAQKVLDGTEDDRVLMKMERHNASWTTRSGVRFTSQHPFQLVPASEVDELIKEGGFRRADPKEVINFYNVS